MADEDRAKAAGGGLAEGRAVPWLEWASAGTGLALALGLFGAIAWQAFDDPDGPPVVTVVVGEIAPAAGGFRVAFEARNEAGSAAAQVEVEARLTEGGGAEPETGRVLFDYIAGHSARKGGFFFTRDPLAGSLTVRASAYAKP